MSAHTIEAILTAKDQNMSSTFDKVMGKADSFGSKLSKGLGFGAWMAIGQKAVNSVFNLIGSSVDGAVKRFDTLNQFPKVMQTLGYGAKEAEASIKTLGDGIQHLPTTLDAVANQTKSIVAVVGDLDKATKLTLALNNAMTAGGASAEQASSAINQWTQAMAKGKPDLQDWRALVQTAPAQMNQLAEATLGAGKTQNDLYNAMKNGAVTIDQVNDKMIELMTQGGEGFASWEEQAKNAGAGIQMSITNVKASVQRNLANIMDGINNLTSKVGGIAGIIQGVVPAFDKLGGTITDILNGDLSFEDGMKSLIYSVSSHAGDFITAGMEIMSNLMNGLAQSAPQILMAMSVALQNLMNKVSEGLPQFVSSGMQMIGAIVTGLGTALPSLINKGVSLLLDLIVAIGTNLPQLIVTGLNAITNLIQGLGSGEGALSSKAVSIAGKIIMAFIQAIPQILSAGINLMVSLLQGITKGFASIPSALMAKAKQIPQAIKSGVGNLAGIGRDMIEGLWNGIKAKFDSVVAKVKAMASALPEAVKKVLGIGSPSRVFRKLGAWTGEGFALGIESMTKAVEMASTDLVSIPSMTNMGMADLAYEYGTTASYEISVPLYVNGREFARATAGDMSQAMSTRDTRQSRLRGVR
jgi:tape measure domain-containing protein